MISYGIVVESRGITVVSSSYGIVAESFGMVVVLVGMMVGSCVDRITCGFVGDCAESPDPRRVLGDVTECGVGGMAVDGDELYSG